MTEQEIEKLREKLGSDYSVKRQNGAITVELVDIWKGVEFAECLNWVKGHGVSFVEGQIYPLTTVLSFGGSHNSIELYGREKDDFKPSTESAYVGQLKAKAKELFGDIKDGDRFELDGDTFTAPTGFEMRYFPDEDLLLLDNYMQCPYIYKQGRWAKKVDKPIRVTIYAEQTVDGKTQVGMTIKSEFPLNVKDRKEFLNHIEEAIESYLNKIP